MSRQSDNKRENNKRSNNKRPNAILLLGSSVLAATWLIVGPDMLEKWSVMGRIADVLVYGPAILVTAWIISGNKKFLWCEYRAWKRIFNC